MNKSQKIDKDEEEYTRVFANRGNHKIRGYIGFRKTENGCWIKAWISGNGEHLELFLEEFDDCTEQLLLDSWKQVLKNYKESDKYIGKYEEWLEDISVEIIIKIPTLSSSITSSN